MTSKTPTRPLRVVVAAGGTVGHLAPALSVADLLATDGAHVEFLVSAGRGDETRVAAHGFEVHPFAISGLPRRPGIAQIRAVFRAVVAVFRCIGMVRRLRPDVLLAGGGYVSAPAALAAWLWRVPVVVTEADAHLGLANRISSRVAIRLCSAYPLSQHRRRQTVTGRPVDPAFGARDRAAARADLDIAPSQRTVLVFGGSGGATRLNDAAADAWSDDPDPRAGEHELVVLHITGRRDHADVKARGAASGRYRVIDYSDDMPTLLAAADLVVARPGGSVFEIAAAGTPAVLVPSPNVTADHQRRNAEHVEVEGGGLVVEDVDVDGARLRELVDELLGRDGAARLAGLAAGMRRFARPDARADIASIVSQVGMAHLRRRP